MSGRHEAYLQFKEDGITSSLCFSVLIKTTLLSRVVIFSLLKLDFFLDFIRNGAMTMELILGK